MSKKYVNFSQIGAVTSLLMNIAALLCSHLPKTGPRVWSLRDFVIENFLFH